MFVYDAGDVRFWIGLTRPEITTSGIKKSTQGQPSLVSYENYKLDLLRSFKKGVGSGVNVNMPSEQSLKEIYNAAKNERNEESRHQADQSILISILMIAISVLLFVTHWRWMQRLAK